MLNDNEDFDDLQMHEETKYSVSHVEKKQNSQVILSKEFTKDEKLIEIYT